MPMVESGRSRSTAIKVDSDDSDAEFEDASSDVAVDDDDFFNSGEGTNHRRLRPLTPDEYSDEAMGGIKFAEEFAARYGTPHPRFFPGSLSDALKESCQQSAKKVTPYT